MYVYKTKSRNDNQIFEVTEYALKILGKKYKAEDIIEIKVTGNLGRFFPVKKNYNRIDAIVDLPPIPYLSGEVMIKARDGEHYFKKVYDVIHVGIILKRFFKETEIYYKYRNKEMKYIFDGEITDEKLEENNTFTVLFVIDEYKTLNEKSLIAKKDDWTARCGFRRSKDDEVSCFDEYHFFSDDDKWVTIYDDSIEFLNIKGLISQNETYSAEFSGYPVMMVSVYENEAIVIVYSKESEDTKVFISDIDNNFKETLKYEDSDISNEYEILERYKENDEYSIEEIMKNEKTKAKEKLEEIAKAFQISSRFLKTGFYGVTYLDEVSKYYFGMGYDIHENRIRLDENKLDVPCSVMHQGMPAFDICEADEEIKNKKEYSISINNIGNYGEGLLFCFSSNEMHKAIMSTMQGGQNGNLEVRNARIIRVKDDIKKLEQFEGEKNVYEETPIEMEYKRVWGKYAFIYEGENEYIPNGIVKKPNITLDEKDKKALNWITEMSKITFKFTVEAQCQINDEIEIVIAPCSNVHGGIARKNVKFEN